MSVALPVAARSEPGFGPRWWSSGVRTRWWWLMLVLTSAVVAADAVYRVRFEIGGWPLFLQVAGAVPELLVGLLFWMWRPRNVVGPLLVTYVSLADVVDLPTFFPDSRLAWTVMFLLGFLYQDLYNWMLFAFPSGRIWNRAAVWLVVWISVTCYLAWGIEKSMISPRSYLYDGSYWLDDPAFSRALGVNVFASSLVLSCMLVVRVVKAAPGARRRLIPLYAGVIWFSVFNSCCWCYFAFTTPLGQDWPRWFGWYTGSSGTLTLVSAFGAAFGLARVRRARSSVADLVVELGRVEPGRVRETLARTLGDPSLVLGLWLPERGVWVDEHGRQIALPVGGDRGVTYIGDRLAVMLHDRDLLDQPLLLEALGSAGRLALENGRLQAELRAQLVELRESRSRIVRTADEERRRLERDLHDGAQQRLLSLGMALQLLRSHVGEAGTALLEETEQELQQALAELRELARGIHPAVLTDQGLDAAVRTLAARAPVPVEVVSEDARLPVEVETAAYFVVAEALANIAKYARARHAWVRIGRANGNVVVEVRDDGVGGAEWNGSGLTGLADRVGALGGRLNVDSPTGAGTRVEAVIPCAS